MAKLGMYVPPGPCGDERASCLGPSLEDNDTQQQLPNHLLAPEGARHHIPCIRIPTIDLNVVGEHELCFATGAQVQLLDHIEHLRPRLRCGVGAEQRPA